MEHFYFTKKIQKTLIILSLLSFRFFQNSKLKKKLNVLKKILR